MTEVEEEKHQMVRRIMARSMYACMAENDRSSFQKACRLYAKAILEVNQDNK